MDPAQVFEQVSGWQCWILARFGVCVYRPNFKPSVHTAVLFLLVSTYISVTFYDLYHFLHDTFRLAFTLVTFAYGLIGINRVGCLLASPESFSEMMQEARETYTQVGAHPREKQILERYTRLLKQCVLFYSGSFFIGCVTAIFFPPVVYLWTGQKVLPVGVELPFIDPDSFEGYLLNYAYQVSLILWTPVGLAAMQNMFIVLVFNICMQYEILLIGLDDLSQLITNNVDCKLNSDVQTKLKQVLQLHQRLDGFSRLVEEHFSNQNFTEISSNAFQIVQALFVLSKQPFWITGYLISFISSVQTLVLCLLGAFIELKSDQLTAKIYDIVWHRMLLPEQKSVLILLAKSQQASLLTYGGLLPINMNLFLMVYKNIYSYLMVLLRM